MKNSSTLHSITKMCVHERLLTRCSSVILVLFFVSFDSEWHASRPAHVLATHVTPLLPRCKVGDGPVKVDGGKKVTWVSCVCEGNGTCSMDVDRLLNWAALFPGHYNVINITCATRMTELAWTNNEPVGVIQDVVIKDCTLAKNTTLFAAKSPLQELWLENLGNEITKSIFQGIESLESLLITHHQHRIMMDFLTELPYLKDLTINGAVRLNSLATELFQHSLQYLDFTNNSITQEGLPDVATVTANGGFNMEDLYLDHNNITDLSRYSFSGRLKYLYLSKNGLHSVHNQTFTKLNILRELDLSNNELTYLPADIFKNLDYLYRVSLEKNRLKELPADLLKGLRSLRYINMGGNDLSSIPSGVFESSLSKLGNVHLYNNNLKMVPRQLLYLPTVDTIDLSNNSIQINSLSDMFINPKNPSANIMIDFKNNNITSIPVVWSNTSDVEILLDMMKNVYYEFSGNGFHCDCQMSGFHRLLYKIQNSSLDVWMAEGYKDSIVCASPARLQGRTVYSLAEADLRCAVYEQCPHGCRCFQHFDTHSQASVIVNCSDTEMTSLPMSLPAGTSELYIDRNKISTLEHRSYLHDLFIVSASYNNITTIAESVVTAMNNVRYLWLQHNSLAYLPPQISELNLTRVSLHHNPLRCDCHTQWMKAWLTRNMAMLDQPADIRCTVSPSGEQEEKQQVTSVPVLDVNEADFVCISPSKASASTSGIHSSVFSSVVVIISVLVTICVAGVIVYTCRRRWQSAAMAHNGPSCTQSCTRCVKKQAACAGAGRDDGSGDLQPLNYDDVV